MFGEGECLFNLYNAALVIMESSAMSNFMIKFEKEIKGPISDKVSTHLLFLYYVN